MPAQIQKSNKAVFGRKSKLNSREKSDRLSSENPRRLGEVSGPELFGGPPVVLAGGGVLAGHEPLGGPPVSLLLVLELLPEVPLLVLQVVLPVRSQGQVPLLQGSGTQCSPHLQIQKTNKLVAVL